MSKLAENDRFIDFSDYGRPVAVVIAANLKHTNATPIHLTFLFGLAGCMAFACILKEWYIFAAAFLILKSILDAADGELSRMKNTPSHTGRYLDSIFDILLNIMFLFAIKVVFGISIVLTVLAFISIQLQGTLYNYYYVILRNKSKGGDQTSKIFEFKSPNALQGERQRDVDVLFKIFYFFYNVFDRIVHVLDREAYKVKSIPNWFMSLVSCYGLGFQLLLMAIMLAINLGHEIIPFFLCYNVLGLIIIGLRKWKIS